jgi:hypothetical protein
MFGLRPAIFLEKINALQTVTAIKGDKANASHKPHFLTKNKPALDIMHSDDKIIRLYNDIS